MPLHSRKISDSAYGSGWDGVTNVAPSQNALYDKIQTLGAGVAVAENTWTPTLGASSANGTHTYSVQEGTYYKLGKLVFISFKISISSKDDAISGSVYIRGLPFTIAKEGGGSLSILEGVSRPASYNADFLVRLEPTKDYLQFVGCSASSWDYFASSGLGATPRIYGSAVYMTN